MAAEWSMLDWSGENALLLDFGTDGFGLVGLDLAAVLPAVVDVHV